jgi:NAD(P)-dependent dehydrogenase (short-subunit alcohol dehydrogenase family)
MDDDDFRVHAALADERTARRVADAIGAPASGEQAVVSRDGAELFAYTASQAAAEHVAESIRAELAAHGDEGQVAITAWHPVAEDWEPVEAPQPADEEARRAEIERRDQTEIAEERADGQYDWEVRARLPDRAAAIELARTLEGEDLPLVRRSHYVIVGAWTEDAADALAERIRSLCPPGSEVHAEGTLELVWSGERDTTSFRSLVLPPGV